VLSGPRSAWRSTHSTRWGRATTSIPSSTRSAARPSKLIARGLERVIQAGGKPISWVSLAAELQRDRAREEMAAEVVELVLTERLLKT
jgi:hypothetical protein